MDWLFVGYGMTSLVPYNRHICCGVLCLRGELLSGSIRMVYCNIVVFFECGVFDITWMSLT